VTNTLWRSPDPQPSPTKIHRIFQSGGFLPVEGYLSRERDIKRIQPRQKPSIFATLIFVIQPKAIKKITRQLMIASSVTIGILLFTRSEYPNIQRQCQIITQMSDFLLSEIDSNRTK